VHRFRRGVGRIIAAVAELSGKDAELQAELQAERSQGGAGAERSQDGAGADGAAGAEPQALRVVPYYHTGADQVPPSPLRGILTLLATLATLTLLTMLTILTIYLPCIGPALSLYLPGAAHPNPNQVPTRCSPPLRSRRASSHSPSSARLSALTAYTP